VGSISTLAIAFCRARGRVSGSAPRSGGRVPSGAGGHDLPQLCRQLLGSVRRDARRGPPGDCPRNASPEIVYPHRRASMSSPPRRSHPPAGRL